MKKKRYLTWDFRRMHYSLQVITFVLAGFAFWGWAIMGVWFLSLIF